MNASLSRRRIVQATGAALATAALPALAQSGWPSRPIRIVESGTNQHLSP